VSKVPEKQKTVLKKSNEQAEACSTGLQADGLAGVAQTLVCAFGKKDGLFQHRLKTQAASAAFRC